jgi:hypothetical protein
MPTPVDLVTDLPADFEVFGQAVDTSLADLLGGTTGQILAKNSNTDMDFVWIANDQGDITGITASSPLTGGGTSGAVTVGIQDATTAQKGAVQLENSTSSTSTTTAAVPASVKSAYDLADAAIPKSLVDAAGDLIYATADNTPARLALGTAGQVLTVNSGASAPEWATPAGGTPTFVGCRLTSSVNPTIAASTYTALSWDGEAFDTDGFHSTSTNTSRITIPAGKAGKYLIQGLVDFDNNATGVRQAIIRLNNTTDEFANIIPPSTTYPSGEISGILDLTVGDYVELWVIQTTTTSQQFFLTRPNGTFSASYLGA